MFQRDLFPRILVPFTTGARDGAGQGYGGKGMGAGKEKGVSCNPRPCRVIRRITIQVQVPWRSVSDVSWYGSNNGVLLCLPMALDESGVCRVGRGIPGPLLYLCLS